MNDSIKRRSPILTHILAFLLGALAHAAADPCLVSRDATHPDPGCGLAPKGTP